MSLLKVACNEFSLLSPCNDVNEVNVLLTLFLLCKAAVYSNRKAANGCASRSLSELGIGSHVTHKDNLIEACHFYASVKF
jgi:hypothetical protein